MCPVVYVSANSFPVSEGSALQELRTTNIHRQRKHGLNKTCSPSPVRRQNLQFALFCLSDLFCSSRARYDPGLVVGDFSTFSRPFVASVANIHRLSLSFPSTVPTAASRYSTVSSGRRETTVLCVNVSLLF